MEFLTRGYKIRYLDSVVANADRTLRRHGNGTKPQKVIFFIEKLSNG